MPAADKIAALPATVRERLDALIVEKGFGDYAGLADWLSSRGHPMHKATVARHGEALRQRIERLRAASALVQVVRTAAAMHGERENARERILAERRGPERRFSVEAVRRIREQVYGLTGELPE